MVAEPDNLYGKLGGGEWAVVRRHEGDSNLGRLSPAAAAVTRLAQRLRKDSRLVGLTAATIAVVIGGVVLRGATGATTTTTFTAVADAYVRSDQVNTNFGSATRLNVRAQSPNEVSYVRFNVCKGLSA
jgi:hypothetical protein